MELYLHSPICLRGLHKDSLPLPYNLSLFVKDETFKQCFDGRKKARVIEKERNKGKEMEGKENEKIKRDTHRTEEEKALRNKKKEKSYIWGTPDSNLPMYFFCRETLPMI